jgi:hypothetical protein
MSVRARCSCFCLFRQGLCAEFDVAMQHLDATLDELNVPKTDGDELVALIMPMRDDIVEVESPQTGTPLPDSYQAAPPLK